MNTHRFTNPGKATQYEIEDLKRANRRCERGWMYAWAGVSEEDHVASIAEWIDLKNRSGEGFTDTAVS